MAKKPPYTPFVPPPASGQKTKAYLWEAALADLLGVTYSANIKKFFDAWASKEQSNAANNPFNITVNLTKAQTTDINSVHVKSFKTPSEGLAATAAFILHYTPGLVGALNAGDIPKAAQSIYGWNGGNDAKKRAYVNSLVTAYNSGVNSPGNNVPTTLSPKAKAEIAAQTAALEAAAKAANQGYVQSTVDLQAQKDLARATAHIGDPWVTVKYDSHGTVTGFGEAYGATPPKNVLTQGPAKTGIPLTRSTFSSLWSQTYANVYQGYTGKNATAQVIFNTLTQGTSPYAMANNLSKQPTFKNSPVFKQTAPTINAYAQTILGTTAPAEIVRQAIVNNWSPSDPALHEALSKLPAYLQGPEYQTNLAQMKTVYQQIYGAPDPTAAQSIREVAANHWTTDQFANYLRTQPQYKTSLEYQTNTVNFLDALGLFTGSQATLTPGAPAGSEGGTPVANAPNVPGVPTPLKPALPFTPSVSGPNG